MKYIITCINNEVEILDDLYNKLSRIVDSDYLVESFINAEQALIACLNHIIVGNEILITINGNNTSQLNCEKFVLELYKSSPNTKNIIFKDSLDIDMIENLINHASLYKIIPNQLKKIDFELIVLEAIKVNAQERRLKDYQEVLEAAVDRRTKEINNINVKLNVLATTDALCGVKNRRSFYESCGPIISYNRRERKPLAVLMLDIDKFKYINDTYGHGVGDEVLKSMAQKTSKILRKSDVFARLGGEEFSALLPNTTELGALKVAENIRQEIEHMEYISSKNETIKFTISIGVATLNSHDINIESVLHRADIALYSAKRNGRNQVVLYNDELIEA